LYLIVIFDSITTVGQRNDKPQFVSLLFVENRPDGLF
jgi:hypothetical protein